jgi:4-methylaminobutanoate oxidase (formaldehyde-forming)
VVVIGGGIVGSSVAYHLTRSGRTDVVLLERRALTCGTTWHAAGLVGQLRSTPSQIRIARYATELYPRLEAETGRASGFRQSGGLYVARTAERMVELRRLASTARAIGVEVAVLSPREAGDRWPMMRTDDLHGGVYLERDGWTRPAATALALAEGARQRGARILEGVRVLRIEQRAGAVTGVVTSHGEIGCEVVVNCAGMWARQVGRLAGVNVPLHAAEHMYLTTGAVAGAVPDLPVLRDPDGYVYLRGDEAGGLVMGGFGPVAKPFDIEAASNELEFARFEPDQEQVRLFLDSACERVPGLREAPIREVMNGPESFTPDTRYLLGEAPELRGFFIAAGLNSVGIASAPGIGRALAGWIVTGGAPMDLWDVDIRRFAPFEASTRYLRDRTTEALGVLYAMHWPHRQPESARPARRSPLHDRLAARGACFGVVAGFERPNWYAPAGVQPAYRYSYGRQNWFDHAAAEHRAVREAVGLLDLSSFAKFLLEGPDAEAVLQRLCANDVGGAVGRVIYTSMLNERGGIECDLTVSRLAMDRYLIVTGAALAVRDFGWIRRHIPAGARATLTDCSPAWAVLGLMGPASRALLSRLTDADLSGPTFRFATGREIVIGYAPAWAQRISYVGELGWELYIPTEFATGVFDALISAGGDPAPRLIGYHAIDSLRCEKGHRSWGHDLSELDTPLEAGLDFAVAWGKPGFIGREALEKLRRGPVTRRLVGFALEDAEPLLLGEEPVWRDGVLVGRISSGAYGHTLGRSVGLGWVERSEGVDSAFLESGRFEVEIAGDRFAARLRLEPFYDPVGRRLRG